MPPLLHHLPLTSSCCKHISILPFSAPYPYYSRGTAHISCSTLSPILDADHTLTPLLSCLFLHCSTHLLA